MRGHPTPADSEASEAKPPRNITPGITEPEQSKLRAARLRDNKRRSRQNQKDYTSDLERRLRELQAQGVRATQEVQASARLVVTENERLRALLRHVGVSDQVIETWQPAAESACSKVVKEERMQPEGQQPPLNIQTHSSLPALIEPQLKPPVANASKSCTRSSGNCQKRAQHLDAVQNEAVPLKLPPCKVLSLLAENSGADVTQSTVGHKVSNDEQSDGVECAEAHRMLMQFATTEEKLDLVSRALEGGCVKKSGGGCKVRHEAIWKAIDEVT